MNKIKSTTIILDVDHEYDISIHIEGLSVRKIDDNTIAVGDTGQITFQCQIKRIIKT